MRRAVIAAMALVILVLACLALVWVGQRRLIYFPMAYLPSPDETGLADTEPVTLATSDGLRLGAWFIRGAGPSSRLTVLVFNGNAGNRAYRAAFAASLRRHGIQILLTDYRGYGGNPGRPSEEGLAIDARAALAYLQSRGDVDRDRIVYFGESLGAAVAVRLAVEHPPAALILRSPFTSLVHIGQFHYPFLPVRLLLRDRFPAIDRVYQIHCPLLVIAGSRDTVVPIDYSRRLYDAVSAPKTFVAVAGTDHNDEELLDGDEMIQAILRVIMRL